ncbi:MAG TPA: hypothetical protein P5349_04270 [Tenuifilaceae bacterium]|nr:hypothetical protein [Tenuifilaceae bacterium]
MRLKLLLLTIALIISNGSFCQKSSYYRRVFVDAEYYLLYEEYQDALPLYFELYQHYPNNANIAYRIGLCYLHIPNQKTKSIKYFEKALGSITDNYKEGYFTETSTPHEVLLYYGEALRINNELDKALKAFKDYQNKLKPNDLREQRVVQKEIESVNYAKVQIENPKKHIIEPIQGNINTQFPEINPLVDSSGNTIYYTSIQRFYNAILSSERNTNTYWKNPINLNAQLWAEGVIKTVGISLSGDFLILARNDNDVFNLYFSKYDKATKTWSQISKFPKEINSKSWETFGSLSATGDTLFFSSNREGGFGGFDIYMSIRTNDGWSNPINLGNKVNSEYDEIAPFVTENGKRLFFSSNGFKTMGGFDLFYANFENNTWGIPQNLGYPINTTDDDTFLFPIKNGKRGFISRGSEKTGNEDIYEVKIDITE